jgi:hypothetical protein
VDAGIAFVNGTDLLLRVALRLDPANPPAAPPLRPLPPMPPRGAGAAPADRGDANAAMPEVGTERERATAVFRAVEAAGFRAVAYAESGNEVRVAVADGGFRALPQVASRVLRAVNGVLPPGAEMLRVSWWSAGAEIGSIAVPRASLEAVAARAASPEEAWGATTVSAADGGLWIGGVANRGPHLDWSAGPRLDLQLGDPSRTARYQVAAAAGGAAVLRRRVGGGRGRAASRVREPRSRAAVRQRAAAGAERLRALRAGGEDLGPRALRGAGVERRAGPVRARHGGAAGADVRGVSAEVLWRPHDAPFAVGLDLNLVRQRDFDGLAGFRRYSVATGHLSLYADLPVWNLYNRFLAVLDGSSPLRLACDHKD